MIDVVVRCEDFLGDGMAGRQDDEILRVEVLLLRPGGGVDDAILLIDDEVGEFLDL